MNITDDTWGSEFFDSLLQRARLSPRRRRHFNLHSSYTEPCQRLLNAVCADSYIPPHRHLADPKDELLVVLSGAIVCWHFNDAGEVTRAMRMDAGGQVCGTTISAHQWHTVTALEPGAVILEVKAGPFDPSAAKLKAPWAPDEGDPAASEFLKALNKIRPAPEMPRPEGQR